MIGKKNKSILCLSYFQDETTNTVFLRLIKLNFCNKIGSICHGKVDDVIQYIKNSVVNLKKCLSDLVQVNTEL